MLGLEEELLSDVSKTELKERHDDIIEEKDTNKNILEEIKNEVHDTLKYKENLNINIQKSNTPNEKTENIIINKEIDIPNKEIIQENNSQKNIDNKKKEKSNSNILLNDIWENDDEEDIHIDDKINKMLDLYFRKSKQEENSLPTKQKDNGEHLCINFVELRNYKDDTNYILPKIYDYEENYQKYNNLKEIMEDSKCYTDLKEKKFGLNHVRSNKTLFYLCLIYSFAFYILFLTLEKTIISIILILFFFIIGCIFQFFYIYRNYYWNCKQLKGEYLKKLEAILNAEINLELYYDDKCIINIPFHSYADISGIQLIKRTIFDDEKLIIEKINLDNYLLLHFPIKYIYFVDSTQQYFKFLITQFNKYCYLKNRDFNHIYEKMYIKFYLKTKNGEIIYKNDPFFFITFTSFNNIIFNGLIILSILLQISFIYILFLKFCTNNKMIEIKKSVSIKHDLEKYLNLNTLFPRITLSHKKIKREKHNVISEQKKIQNEFIKNCVNLTNMIKQHFEDKNSSNLERYGYLTPFTSQKGFFDSRVYYYEYHFFKSYGRKVEKILGKNTIFKNYKDDIDDIFDNDDNYDKDKDDIDKIVKKDNNITNSKELKQIIYSEKVLSLTCDISSFNVMVHYNIKLSNGHNKTGTFKLDKKLGNRFEKLEEKVNGDWTKSEIIIPGCQDKIEIIRKKRAVKISAGNFVIISDTKLNDDLHGGYPSWVNGDSWDPELIKKYVKDCNKISNINRYKIKYN